jgi:hypothetical protein
MLLISTGRKKDKDFIIFSAAFNSIAGFDDGSDTLKTKRMY